MVTVFPFQFSTLRTFFLFFFFNDTATTEIYTLSLHDALPICLRSGTGRRFLRRTAPSHARYRPCKSGRGRLSGRSEEHTSELQSLTNLVCRLLLEKKKKKKRSLTIMLYVI